MMLATTECFFFNDTATTEIYTLSLHDALPISGSDIKVFELMAPLVDTPFAKDVNSDAKVPPAEVADALLTNLEQDVLGMHVGRSEEHTSELQSRQYLVCRLLLEKKKNTPRSED